ncbi:hypothetical protein OG978_32505 [Streptomyces sp. NBC_01591]|uniref:hypothetical protein n=1 Tax=Streptomyces sp. NBC_01591 TaxID=2975888 RepID=UPI002DDBF02A|nr:hypothetical protein [Streptomyces sp. NBC_01591]WSD71696.1 hypothetical protein OG978_32505 [Streptomyces sp. NBC_01591]
MIPDLHRMKGGAAQLGVRPGLPGPFGTWHEEPDDDAEAALGAEVTGPVRRRELHDHIASPHPADQGGHGLAPGRTK